MKNAFAAFLFTFPVLSVLAQECNDQTIRSETSQLAKKSGNWFFSGASAEYHLNANYDKNPPHEQKLMIEMISWNDRCNQSKPREIHFFRQKRLVGVSHEDGVVSVFYR